MEPSPRRAEDHRLINESLAVVAPRAPELVAVFYGQLFDKHPEVRAMFPTDMAPQRDQLLKAIVALATHYNQPVELAPALTAMGRSHGARGVTITQYGVVGETLLATLARFAGEAWNAQYADAWGRAYTWAAGLMLAAGVEGALIPAPRTGNGRVEPVPAGARRPWYRWPGGN